MIGAVLGVFAAHLMFAEPVFQISATGRDGPAQAFSEAVATFGLIGTILAARKFDAPAAPYLVGLYIAAAYWFTASTSFANPAVAIARSFSDTFAGLAPRSVPSFIVAQIVGAIAAYGIIGWMITEKPRP